MLCIERQGIVRSDLSCENRRQRNHDQYHQADKKGWILKKPLQALTSLNVALSDRSSDTLSRPTDLCRCKWRQSLQTALQHSVVSVVYGGNQQCANARPAKYIFNDNHAADQGTKLQADHRHSRNKRIAQRMSIDHLTLKETFCTQRLNIFSMDLLKHGGTRKRATVAAKPNASVREAGSGSVCVPPDRGKMS